MDACLHIARQADYCFSIPVLGTGQLRFGDELAPKHAKLKANPRNGEWRNILVFPQGLSVGVVCVVNSPKSANSAPSDTRSSNRPDFAAI